MRRRAAQFPPIHVGHWNRSLAKTQKLQVCRTMLGCRRSSDLRLLPELLCSEFCYPGVAFQPAMGACAGPSLCLDAQFVACCVYTRSLLPLLLCPAIGNYTHAKECVWHHDQSRTAMGHIAILPRRQVRMLGTTLAAIILWCLRPRYLHC